MNMSRTGFFSVLVFSLFLASCASPPTVKADPGTGKSGAPAAETAAAEAATGEAAVAAEPDSAVPEADTPAETPVTASPTETLPVETPAEPPVPENPEEVPPLPPGERILYYYPEPQDLFVPPAPAAVTPAKPAVPKIAPVPAPAPVAAAVPKPAAKPAPAAKAEALPAEKAAETVLPGIWESEITPAAAPERIPPVPPSRKTTLAVGQTLEVWYPGSGWVYLGDSSAQNGLAYETRKLDKTDTLFTFKALKSGNYILDFSRFDLLEDAFSSDSLAVEVSDTASKRTERIRAPNYRGESTVSAGAGSSSAPAQPAAAGQTVPATMTDEPGLTTTGSSSGAKSISATTADTRSAPVPAVSAIDADAALGLAKKALGANDPVTALEQLDRFFSAAVSALDEGWFLRGQAYEANGAVRDIRKALAAYETLVSAYPDSIRWKEADARIRYIKQFYLRIR